MCSNRVRGVLMGHLVGDALGARYEFKTAKQVKEMIGKDMKNDEVLRMLGGGKFKWSVGEITDDSEMALSLAACLLRKNLYDQATIATGYVRWIQSKPKSSGRTTRLALKIVNKVPKDWLETWSDEERQRLLQMIQENVREKNEESLSNGFLMRISPLPAFYYAQCFENWSNFIAEEVSITHANPTTIDAAQVYTKAIHQLINGARREAVYEHALSSTKNQIVKKHLELAANQISPFPYGHQLSLSTNGDDQIMGYFGIAFQQMSTNSLDWYEYNPDEKDLLIRSWALIQPQKQSLGCDIYEMIFNQCPETRYLFPKIDAFGHKKELRKNNEFVFQALRFMQVVESSMRNLDSLNNMNTILDNLGRRHGKLELVGKFRPYYWSVFLEAMIFHVRKFLEANHRKFPEKEIDGAIIVWRTLLKDIVHRIKVGYVADIEHRLNQLAESCHTQISLHDRKRSTGSGNGHLIRQSTVEDDASDDFRSSRCLAQRHTSTSSYSAHSGFSNRKQFLKDRSLPEDSDAC